MISLWVSTAYLMKNSNNKLSSLLTAMPATFMSGVSATYILMAKEGFQISSSIAYPVGVVVAISFFAIYLAKLRLLSSERDC